MNAALDDALRHMFGEQKDALVRSFVIKQALKRAGLNQKAVAQELDVTESAVSRFVSGQTKSARFDEWLKNRLGLDFEGEVNG